MNQRARLTPWTRVTRPTPFFGCARADIALNAAVARDFLPHYAVDNPARACERLALALSQPASKP